jgi:hypothetical protein
MSEGVAVVSPTQLDVPSVWAVSQQTLEVVDHGVAPRVIPVERRTQNSSRSCEEQVKKGISDLA